MEFLFTCPLLVFSVTIFYSSFLCKGSDTLFVDQPLFSNQSLVSKGGKFELGFFSPLNSTNYYVGIWYKNIPFKTVIWVFNRDATIPYSYFYNHTQLQLSSNGTLGLYLDMEEQYYSWETPNVTKAVLLDTGNLLFRNSSGDVVWQSFEDPTDTWLPGMKLRDGMYFSWMNPRDPSFGMYSLTAFSGDFSILLNRSQTIWRSWVWERGVCPVLFDHSTFSNSHLLALHSTEVPYFMYDSNNASMVSRIVLEYVGHLTRFGWSEAKHAWIVLSSTAHIMCWPNTICSAKNSPQCRCLDGFVPILKKDWDLSDFSKGCERKKPLNCGGEGKNKTIFVKVSVARLPANAKLLQVSNVVCEFVCATNCLCTAYAYNSIRGGVCLLFMGDFSAMETPPRNFLGIDIYIKTESNNARKVLALALIVSITAAMIISCFGLCYIWPKLKSKVSRETNQNLLLFYLNSSISVRKEDAEEKERLYELPVFSFDSIVASTNNFSITNKLGQGGFGPVYKGKLINGEFVAVKRLCRRSSQGVEEFKNEMKLIAKLQHRNLVGILGCCNENDEMILVYEYMPNKSLDMFLFESTKKELLNWNSRVHIISGIAQGILYLHQYSRLRIVHRDLKASNILLDAEMNPKISDFGMARIFGGTELQANTKRIVGTYGYMSPEYAMEGFFSVKSDVFAFGVLMLEIISGKKSTGTYGSENLSLLRYTWHLWKSGCIDELIEPVLELTNASLSIALRYIQISLLCVEENPGDRPLMSDVVGMLNNEKRAIAPPQNPGFTVGRTLAKPVPVQQEVGVCLINDMTASRVEAR